MIGDGERLAWILGSSRSGSTWLLRMLAATGKVAPIDDPHLGHHLGVWRPIALAWGAAAEEPRLTTLDAVKAERPDYFFSERYREAWLPALRTLVATRFEAQAAEAPGRDPVVVVKEPGSQAAPLLLELFPRAALVFLLRDGRDVVDSWLDAHRPDGWAQREGAFTVSEEGRLPLIRWLATVWVHRTEVVQRAFEAHDPARRVLVRYEELLADAPAHLERVAATIGLRTSKRRLRQVASALDVHGVPTAERGRGQFIRAASPGGWRDNLDDAEQRALLEIVGPKLCELGYVDHPQTAAA